MNSSVVFPLTLRLDRGRCLACGNCSAACAAEGHPPRLKVLLAERAGPHGGEIFPAPSLCWHCARPACAAVCPTACLTPGPQGVLPRRERCLGCRLCLMVCPAGGPVFDSAGKVDKCDLCAVRRRRGQKPACVAACPTGSLHLVDLGQYSTARRRAVAASRASGGRYSNRISR